MGMTISDDFECDADTNEIPSPNFLPSIVVTDEKGLVISSFQYSSSTSSQSHSHELPKTEIGASVEERKLADLNDLFEKYDFQCIADKLLTLGNKLELSLIHISEPTRPY